MDTRFLPHNLHWTDPARYHRMDPHLRLLATLPLVHRSALLERIPRGEAGIFTVSGGRQVGKTTLLKQWMADRLAEGLPPRALVYLTGELVDDHHSLVRLVSDALADMPAQSLNYVIFDEATYVRDWDKGVKFLADAGLLENTALIITGSDTVILKQSRMRFPGRRGRHAVVDFHLHPLSFRDCVDLKGRIGADGLGLLESGDGDSQLIDRLFEEFHAYLAHGGFLTAINDLARSGRILPATFATYSDWIRGDFLKRNKKEAYLQEVIAAIIRRYGSQVTWNSLAGDLSIDHPMTVTDYVQLLSAMGAAFIQPAIREDKLAPAPKKARKLMFSDPFIFHALRAWVEPTETPYETQVLPMLNDDVQASTLVEACAATHFSRCFPTYYIKAAGEVDIAYVDGGRFWPVEIKWTRQVRPGELKQIGKYPNGRILTRRRQSGRIGSLPTAPLPLALLRPGGQAAP